MKKLLYTLACTITFFTQGTIYWNQDRPFVGLPPMPQQIYRCPLNEIRRCTPGECRDNAEIERRIYRKDILKFIREEKARNKQAQACQKQGCPSC